MIIFNPADITGLITLLYSGLRPSQLTTLAALDSIRLQSQLTLRWNLAYRISRKLRAVPPARESYMEMTQLSATNKGSQSNGCGPCLSITMS